MASGTVRASSSKVANYTDNPKQRLLDKVSDQKRKNTWHKNGVVSPTPGGVSFAPPTVWQTDDYPAWLASFVSAINSGELDAQIRDWAPRAQAALEKRRRN